MILLATLAHAGSLFIGPDTVVVVTDIGSGDTNAASRTLVGEVCAVATAGLSSGGDGWWKGGLSCADGKAYTFTKVGVAVAGD